MSMQPGGDMVIARAAGGGVMIARKLGDMLIARELAGAVGSRGDHIATTTARGAATDRNGPTWEISPRILIPDAVGLNGPSNSSARRREWHPRLDYSAMLGHIWTRFAGLQSLH